MIKIGNIKVPVGNQPDFKEIASKRLRIPLKSVQSAVILKRAVDARDKGNLLFVYHIAVQTDANEEKLVALLADKEITVYRPPDAEFPKYRCKPELPPVVVGAGPAGLFAALALAHAGMRPIVLERGLAVDERVEKVCGFWTDGAFSEEASVQFGEGGAGTFSDGKLNTGITDVRCQTVRSEFVRCGAPEEILYDAKPHIGTDVLVNVVRSLREKIISLGGEVRFRSKVTDIRTKNGKLAALVAKTPDGEQEIPCSAAVFAVGHSARDTFELLWCTGCEMAQKDFSVGVRIEHLQERINFSQYGKRWRELPPADYKLALHLASGRNVYTFCMCPGGTVVNAASEQGGVVTNGMSAHARDGKNANSALLVSVGKQDFASAHPLAGVEFQRKYERAAFALSDSYRAPCQRVADFLTGKPTKFFGAVKPTYLPGVVKADLKKCLPEFAVKSIAEALPQLDRRLRGFADGDAVMTGVETRSSSPVRVLRNENGESNIAGIYPCGEGAGYAGGIMSAAVDGMRAAEHIIAAQLGVDI